MYGKELKALANSSKGFLKKDREIIRRFFHSQSQFDDKGLTRPFRINTSHSKRSLVTKIPQSSLVEISAIAESQRRSSPDLFSIKQFRGRGTDISPSIGSMEFNRTMSQMRKTVDLGEDESYAKQRSIRTSSMKQRPKSYAVVERPQESAGSTPSRGIQSSLKRLRLRSWHMPENSESLSISQPKIPQEGALRSQKSSLPELSPTNQRKEISVLAKLSADPSIRVDPEASSVYLKNRKKYNADTDRPLRGSPKKQNDDIIVRKLTIERIKNEFYLPRKTRSYFPEAHIDYRKLKEIQRADAEKLKEEQRHFLPPDQELKITVWRKKITITNLFRARKKEDLTADERKNFYKKLVAEYAPAQTKHPKEFAEEIFLFLQQQKEAFLGSATL